jgi:DNA helicase-2/ATP-dependent DNA helicase PcrA
MTAQDLRKFRNTQNRIQESGPVGGSRSSYGAHRDWREKSSPVVCFDPGSFRVGDKVEHPKFGSGFFMGVSGEGLKAEITVVFSGEVKKLIAEYADWLNYRVRILILIDREVFYHG